MKMSARFAVRRFVSAGRSVERCCAAGTPRVVPERLRVVIVVGVVVRGWVCGAREEAESSFRPGGRVNVVVVVEAMVMLFCEWIVE